MPGFATARSRGGLSGNAVKVPSNKGGKATVLEYGTYNEFGLGVPERSFIRGTADAKGKEWRDFAASRMRLVIKGELTKEQALEQMGLRFQSNMQKRISDGIPPPNAPSTTVVAVTS